MKNKLGIITILILTVALAAGLMLVSRNQDSRKSAHFAEAKVYLMPSDISMNVGEEKIVHVYIDSGDVIGLAGTKAKVQNIQTQVCFDEGVVLAGEPGASIAHVADSGFDSVALAKNTTENGRNCVNIAIVADDFDGLKSGAAIDVAKITIKGSKVATGNITVNADKTTLSGENAASELDKYIKVSEISGTSFRVTQGGGANPTDVPVEPTTAPTGEWPILNFKIAFRDIKEEAKCGLGEKSRVSIVALAKDGTKKSYDGVVIEKTSEKNSKGRAIYKGSVELKNFSYRDDVAVFIKGPRELQWKYGVDNQSEAYNKAGGELAGLKTTSDSPTFDFSEYPLIPGDITSGSRGVQDGQIDGRDFSLVKSEGGTGVKAPDGTFVPTDLNGDCLTISLDYIFLLESIKEKQEQIY